METWDEMYSSIDFESIPGYTNKSVAKRSGKYPRFEGLVVLHVVEFFTYMWRHTMNMTIYKYDFSYVP
jgi:hypothetical protein